MKNIDSPEVISETLNQLVNKYSDPTWLEKLYPDISYHELYQHQYSHIKTMENNK